MHPVQDFKDNFEEPALAVDTLIPDEDTADIIYLHETESQVRNVCFVWPDGRKAFYNYAYLMGAAFDLNTDKNRIMLNFSAQNVTLLGYRLEPLFISLIDHLPRVIEVVHPRYACTDKPNKPIVVDIVVGSKED